MPIKITLNDVKNLCEKDNTICLSEVYVNNYDLLCFKCINGHIYKMSWSNFKQGHRCKYCAGLNKKDISYIKEFASKNNTICKSTFYINAHEKLQFICDKGHEYTKSWNKFKNGQRCNICYLNNKMGEKNSNWNSDRTRRKKIKFLSFNHKNFKNLKDDPNYELYLNSKKEVKLSQKNWYKSNYEIDHIFPKVAFIDNKLDQIYGISKVKKICNLRENLRIISKNENREKWGYYDQKEFMEWFNEKIRLQSYK